MKSGKAMPRFCPKPVLGIATVLDQIPNPEFPNPALP
jgi:hypothetical protein